MDTVSLSEMSEMGVALYNCEVLSSIELESLG